MRWCATLPPVVGTTSRPSNSCPKAWPGEPESVHAELHELKAQIEQRFSQPTLF
jgi:hypothetical protein